MTYLGKAIAPICSVTSDYPDLSRLAQALHFCFSLLTLAIIWHRFFNVPSPKNPLLFEVGELFIPYPPHQLDLWAFIDLLKIFQASATCFFNQEKDKDECDDVEDGENAECSSCMESIIDLW